VSDRLQQVLSGERLWHVQTCDVLDGLRSLPDGCVQCCVTSPPYYALRDYGIDGQIGLESSLGDYLNKLTEVFREVRRVLRDDGTFWLNIGDTYCTDSKWGGSSSNKNETEVGYAKRGRKWNTNCKDKDLLGVPWLLAFHLRNDGWWLRSEIIWHKPNPMPESVNDRPSKSHEQIFLLSKSRHYFYDAEAVKEAQSPGTFERFGTDGHRTGSGQKQIDSPNGLIRDKSAYSAAIMPNGRNCRSVWSIAINGFKEAHFATFPPAIPETCLKAGTSAKGCCSVCGTPWERVTESERLPTRPGDGSKVHGNGSEVTGNRDPERHVTTTKTTGWQPGCECKAAVLPCLTLDVFNGAGTSGLVAAKGLGLRYIGFELNPEYADMARRRIERGFIEGSGTVKPDAAQRGLFT
jgi:DNA modification methylase